jgi:hypothetical protein
MVHLVQVLLSGCAEAPRAFCEETAARTAYVAAAKKYWAQSYAAYCERSGLDSNDFASAQAFVAGFDLAERSRLHYWTIKAEDAPGGQLAGLTVLQEGRQRLAQLAATLEQTSAAVREELTLLLASITPLPDETAVAAPRPTGAADSPRSLGGTEPAAAPVKAAVQPATDTYNTKEWHDYVETIKNMCGGNRSEYHLFTRQDWRQAVYSNQTAFEYWQWVAATIDDHIERAQQAGYGVEPALDMPGHYRFRTPDGSLSDSLSPAEGEAWCRAGLHLDGKG